MKRTTLIIAVLLLALARPAVAGFVFDSGFQNGGVIPDGNLTGWSDTRTLSGAPISIPNGGVSVTLNLSGGYNGDLYAYLVHNSGFAVLLNRVGRGTGVGDSVPGYGDAGMNVVLKDGGSLGNIHAYGGGVVPSGSFYAPDGRNISPLATVGSFDSGYATALLSSFNGLDANGSWTLFIADVSGGDVSLSKVESWGLDIAAVPEPASIIEGGIAVLFLGGVVAVYRLRGAKLRPLPADGVASHKPAILGLGSVLWCAVNKWLDAV